MDRIDLENVIINDSYTNIIMSNFYIPPGVITEILLCLPIRSIFRYKSVCKLWKTIIEAPRFVSMHLKKTKKPHLDKFLLECHTVSITTPTTKTRLYGFLPLVEQDKIVDWNCFWTKSHKPESWIPSPHVPAFCSCNGLICLLVNHGTKFRIMNPLYPSIFDVIEVEVPYDEPRLLSPLLAGFGFGFDELSHRFKIMCLFENNEDRSDIFFELLVHELGGSTTSWRKLPQISLRYPNINFYYQEKSAVFLDGCIHWVACFLNGSGRWIASIASFNLSSETLEVIQLPWEIRHDVDPNLFDFDGRLGLAVEEVNNEVSVFCREGRPKKWIKKFCISNTWGLNYVEWIYLLGGYDIVMKSSFGGYLSYNIQTGITTILTELSKDIGFICHQGTLVRPSHLASLTTY